MPQKTRKYKDLDLALLVHPETKDLVYLKDEDAVKRAIKNLILTNSYEKHFSESFGGNIITHLFEPSSYFTALNIQQNIENALMLYETRAKLENITVDIQDEELGYDVTISFYIQNKLEPIKISLFLERVR